MGRRVRVWAGLGVGLCAAGLMFGAAAVDAVTGRGSASAQPTPPPPDAKAIVQQAVNTELEQSRDDHSHWRYVENEDGNAKYVVVETQDGALKRHIEENGAPASAATLRQDDAYNQKFIHDPSLQQKEREAGAHDDRSATELLNEMPVAFVWKFERETADEMVLSYQPNPDYHPPDMESRVMGKMAGTMIVSKPGHRIKTFKGTLTDDISIGWGLLARIKQGGTFDVERRQVAPGLWEITETHVHISGHALFFKTIGQQQDEVKTDFTAVPLGTTLEQAIPMLIQPQATNGKGGCCGLSR